MTFHPRFTHDQFCYPIPFRMWGRSIRFYVNTRAAEQKNRESGSSKTQRIGTRLEFHISFSASLSHLVIKRRQFLRTWSTQVVNLSPLENIYSTNLRWTFLHTIPCPVLLHYRNTCTTDSPKAVLIHLILVTHFNREEAERREPAWTSGNIGQRAPTWTGCSDRWWK